MRRRTRFLTITTTAAAVAGSALAATGAPAQTSTAAAAKVVPTALHMWLTRTATHRWKGNLHLILPSGVSGNECAFGPVRVRAKLHGQVKDQTTPKLDDHCRATFKVRSRGPVDPHDVVVHAKFLGTDRVASIHAHKDRL